MGSRTSRTADQQPLLDDRDEEPLIEKISVVLMGHHGVGKNTVGNAILKKKAFTFQDRTKNYYLKDENTTFDRHVTVIRVPGWSADLISEKNMQLWQVIKDSVRSVQDGPHVIILVVNKNTECAATTKEKLKQLLGDNVFQHILIFSVDATKIMVHHSDRKQTIINRCKYHFFVRCTCANKLNRMLIKTIEDFIVCKHDIRFYALGKKAPNPELQHQDLANLVDRLKCKISSLSDSLDSNMDIIESQNAEIRELKRLLKEKEDMLRAKEEDIERLKSHQNHTELSVLRKKNEQLEHAAKQEEKMKEEFKRKIGEMEKERKEYMRKLEKLQRENQALKSQKKKKKRTKPSSIIGPRQKDTNSIELISLTSAGGEALQASEVHKGVQFVKKYRKELIERIVAVKPIADDMLQFIGHYKYEKILQAPTEYEQRRQLYDTVDKGGKKLQIEFNKCLLKHEQYLVEELEESP